MLLFQGLDCKIALFFQLLCDNVTLKKKPFSALFFKVIWARNMKYLLRIIAVVTAATAFYVLFPTYWLMRHWWQIISAYFQGVNPFQYFEFWIYPAWALMDLILIFKLISSYRLFRFRKWGRTVALYVLFSDFLLRLGGVINTWTYHFRHPELYSKLQSNPPLPEYTLTYSMIPSYVIALLSLISVIILLSKPVKEIYLSNSHNNRFHNDALKNGRVWSVSLGDDIVTIVRIPFRIFIADGILALHKFSFELSDIKGMCLGENWILKATHYEICVEEDIPWT